MKTIAEILKGKKTVDVYTELMSASNIFNFSNDTHHLYIKKSIKYFEENLSDWSKKRNQIASFSGATFL